MAKATQITALPCWLKPFVNRTVKQIVHFCPGLDQLLVYRVAHKLFIERTNRS